MSSANASTPGENRERGARPGRPAKPAPVERPPRPQHELPERIHGTPPWLISFGDMMTLFLCFFIMLVTLATRQDAGLIAAGVGPFIAALENHGMDAALSGAERLQAVNEYRERFGLDPLSDPDNLIGAAEVAGASQIESLVKQSLQPYFEMRCPMVATFEAGSAELGDHAHDYLDLIAETLRPGRGQVLVLEGYSADASAGERARSSAARAQSVRAYLIERHAFVPQRVEARAWALEPPAGPSDPARVDARFIQPLGPADA